MPSSLPISQRAPNCYWKILKGQPEKGGGVRCERVDRTLSVVLKTLPESQGSEEPCRGPDGGLIERFGVRIFLGVRSNFGGFDKSFLGRSPISGCRLKLPLCLAST